MQELDIWHLRFDEYELPDIKELSPKEQEKASGFKFEVDRNNYIKSHLFLRDVLTHYFPEHPKSSWKYTYNAYGKPFLADNFNLFFNLSHNDSHAYIVCSRYAQCGIDIEAYHDIELSPELCDMVLSQAEQKSIDQKLFFKYWTLKEAYVKALGKGLSMELNRVDFSDYIKKEKFVKDEIHYFSYCKEAYSLSVALLSDAKEISVNFYTQENL